MKKIPRIYIAGPYASSSRWGEEQNVRNAESLGYEVAKLGAYPVIPHANTRHYFSEAQPDKFWYQATLDEMLTCDGVMMVEHWEESYGSTKEKQVAESKGLPIFYPCDLLLSADMLRKWIAKMSLQRQLSPPQ